MLLQASRQLCTSGSASCTIVAPAEDAQCDCRGVCRLPGGSSGSRGLLSGVECKRQWGPVLLCSGARAYTRRFVTRTTCTRLVGGWLAVPAAGRSGTATPAQSRSLDDVGTSSIFSYNDSEKTPRWPTYKTRNSPRPRGDWLCPGADARRGTDRLLAPGPLNRVPIDHACA